MSRRVEEFFNGVDTSLIDHHDSLIIDLKHKLYDQDSELRIDHWIVFTTPEMYHELRKSVSLHVKYKDAYIDFCSKHGIITYAYTPYPRVRRKEIHILFNNNHHTAFLNMDDDYDNHTIVDCFKLYLRPLESKLYKVGAFSKVMSSNRPLQLKKALESYFEQELKKPVPEDLYDDLRNHLRTTYGLSYKIDYSEWLEDLIIKIIK